MNFSFPEGRLYGPDMIAVIILGNEYPNYVIPPTLLIFHLSQVQIFCPSTLTVAGGIKWRRSGGTCCMKFEETHVGCWVDSRSETVHLRNLDSDVRINPLKPRGCYMYHLL
jgi:hypothetical protein